MQIVIDIPEKEYEEIIGSEDCGLHTLTRAIAKGTVLPKRHGRLIDADNVKSHFSDKEGDAFTAFHFYDAVESEKKI